jgi:pyruvate kinase
MPSKHTNILVTIGPSSADNKTFKKMIAAGMNWVRINTAHDDFSEYQKHVTKAKKAGLPVMIDIKGPELRVRLEKEMLIAAKSTVVFYTNKRPRFNYHIYDDVERGTTVYFDDGQIEGTIVKKKDQQLSIHFKNKCLLKPNKGVNIPGCSLNIPSLSKKDRNALLFANKNKAEFIAVSFARNKEDILNVKRRLNYNAKIIAKIESREGIENLNEILDESDGIMVARGDLGIEIPFEDIPAQQKIMVTKAKQKGKIAIVATQILETMIEKPNPTRAEINDIATAVLQGADTLMLSGETAVGKYPVEAITVMARVAERYEKK